MRLPRRSSVIPALILVSACSAKPSDDASGTSDLTTLTNNPFDDFSPTKLASIGDVNVEGAATFDVLDDDTAIYYGAPDKGECVRTSFYLARAGKTPAVRPLLPAGAWLNHRVSPDKKWIAVLGAPDAECSDGRQELYLAPLDGDEAGTPVSLGPGTNDFDFYGQSLVFIDKSRAHAIDLSTKEEAWNEVLGGETPFHVTSANGKGLLLYTSKRARAGIVDNYRGELGDITSLPLPTRADKDGIVAAFDPAGSTLTLNVATNGGYELYSAPITAKGIVAKQLTSETLAEPARVRADGTIVFDTAKAVNVIAPGATDPATFTATGKIDGRQLSLDGKWVGAFVGDAPGSLAIAPADKSGKLTPLALSGVSDINWYTFSQDGKKLLFSAKNASGHKRLFTLALPATSEATPKELPVDDPALVAGSIGSPSGVVVRSNVVATTLVNLDTGETTSLGELSEVVTWKNEVLVYRTRGDSTRLNAITSDGKFKAKINAGQELLSDIVPSPSGKSLFFTSASVNLGTGGIYRVTLPTYDKSKTPPPADKTPGGTGKKPGSDSTSKSPSDGSEDAPEAPTRSDESSSESSDSEETSETSTTSSSKAKTSPKKSAGDSGCSVGPATPLSSDVSPRALAGLVAAAAFVARRRKRQDG
jgi:MYXO-CTERM domain-containing protein